jgi:hypothetical protein
VDRSASIFTLHYMAAYFPPGIPINSRIFDKYETHGRADGSFTIIDDPGREQED